LFQVPTRTHNATIATQTAIHQLHTIWLATLVLKHAMFAAIKVKARGLASRGQVVAWRGQVGAWRQTRLVRISLLPVIDWVNPFRACDGAAFDALDTTEPADGNSRRHFP